MDGHAPLPWSRGRYAGTDGIDDAEGHSVADAVNAHDRLVEAARALVAVSRWRLDDLGLVGASDVAEAIRRLRDAVPPGDA
jgi:hypothetical protein